MMSQPDLQTIVIHIFPNISRSKGNQTIKFGQLIGCNIFVEKSKCGNNLVPEPFLKN